MTSQWSCAIYPAIKHVDQTFVIQVLAYPSVCVCVCVYIYNLFLNSFPLSPRNFLGPLIKILSSKITPPFTKLKIVYPKIIYSIFTNWKSSIQKIVYSNFTNWKKKSIKPILPNGKKNVYPRSVLDNSIMTKLY